MNRADLKFLTGCFVLCMMLSVTVSSAVCLPPKVSSFDPGTDNRSGNRRSGTAVAAGNGAIS